MKALEFVYWLQGYVEVTHSTSPDVAEWNVIAEKLSGVKHISDNQCDPYEHTLMPGHFVTWLKGYVEIAKKVPSVVEWQVIKDHLQLVFTKVAPAGQEKNKVDMTDWDRIVKEKKDIDDFRIYPPKLDPTTIDPWKPTTPWPNRPYGPIYCATQKTVLTDYPESTDELPGS